MDRVDDIYSRFLDPSDDWTVRRWSIAKSDSYRYRLTTKYLRDGDIEDIYNINYIDEYNILIISLNVSKRIYNTDGTISTIRLQRIGRVPFGRG
jgi:hypothetical protein